MSQQLPANVDISAPILLVNGREIDKFMGMTNFVYENPSDLMDTHPGTAVGIESNSSTNRATCQIAVHSTSRDYGTGAGGLAYLEGIVKSGAPVTIEVKVPTSKLGLYRRGQIVRRGAEVALIKGGGGVLGGKNEGPITFNIECMNAFTDRLGWEVPLPEGHVDAA